MKKIIGILLISFLGFLGCSDNDTTNTVDQATPVAPFGIVETPTPTYEWTPVPWATKYRLLVQETNQDSTTQDTTETYIIDEWYTAGEADCTSEETLCIVTPEIEVIGKNEFKILACANEECGSWSDTLTFDFTATNTPRFTDHDDGTVTDNKTQLMWFKSANSSGPRNWNDAMFYGEEIYHAGYRDWQPPSLSEMKSLMDTRYQDCAVPLINPFTNIVCTYNDRNRNYWTSTVWRNGPEYYAWYVDFFYGRVDQTYKDDTYYVWPVRSVK